MSSSFSAVDPSRRVMDRETARRELDVLRGELPPGGVENLNEAETRLLYIDRILQLLGWDATEYKPETPSGGSGYTDYLLTMDDVPSLVLEAKRTGKTFKSRATLARSEYTLTYAKSAFGQPFAEVLAQAERYAKEHGLSTAAISNGDEWLLVQILSHPGKDPEELKCFYFGRLLSGEGNFDLLWELLSREAIANGRTFEALAELNAKQFEISLDPGSALGPLQLDVTAVDAPELSAFYRFFFAELVDPGRRQMLEKCFVSSSKLDQYDGNLRRLLKDSSPSFVDSSRELQPGDVDAMMPLESGDQRGPVVIVAGSVGCGKSTFVTRALVEQRREGQTAPLLLDLIDQFDDERDVDRTDELWEQVRSEWLKEAPEWGEYPKLRMLFDGEVRALKTGAKSRIFQTNEGEFAKAEAELLNELFLDPRQFLPRCWRRFRRDKKKGVVVFLDNVDRASELYQRTTYAFAHSLATKTGATVILPMREMTFFRGKHAGFLDIRASDVVFHLQAPDPVQVVSRRIKYIEDHLNSDHRAKTWRQSPDYEERMGRFRKHADTIKQRLLVASEGRPVIELATAVAWHDVRLFFLVLQEIHTTLSDSDWNRSRALGALLLSRRSGSPARIPNIYSSPYPSFPCAFIKARVLALLLHSLRPEQVTRGLTFSEVIRYLRMYGYRDRWCKKAVEEMVRDRLLECLEGPAAAEFSKSYVLVGSHSFRPSPLGLVVFDELQFDPSYLGVVGSGVTFHSRESHDRYVDLVQHLSTVIEGDSGNAAVDLLMEPGPSLVVASHLRRMLDEERVDEGVVRSVPRLAIVEECLVHCFQRLPGAANPTRPKNATRVSRAEQTSLALECGDESAEEPIVPIPENAASAKVHGSTLAPAVLWALAELQARGQTPSTGAQITQMINKHVFSDAEKKEPTNVSRALRSPTMRKVGWLAVYGEKGAWRYGLAGPWRRAWNSTFGVRAPKVADKS